jgi:hypothetical protein
MPQLRIVMFLFCSALLFSCNGVSNEPSTGIEVPEETESNLESLEWLNGKWIGEHEGKIMVEEWERLNDTEFNGNGYTINEMDTNFIEQLSLIVMNDWIYYNANVTGSIGAVPFKLVSEKPNQFIFENKENDFPTRIRYTYQEPNNLHVVISGSIDGERTKVDFYFKKVD